MLASELDEGQNPRSVGPPRERWPTSRPKPERLRGPTARPLVAARGRRTREAWGAAERGRGRDASFPQGREAGDGHACASRKRVRAGSLPDGGPGGSIDRHDRRTVGSRPHGQSSHLASTRSQATALEDARGTGSSRPGTSARTPHPRAAGVHARGDEAQESTDRATVALARAKVVARTDSRGEQSFEAGVPVAIQASPAEPRTASDGARKRPVRHLATPGTRRPGLAVELIPTVPRGAPGRLRREVGAPAKGAANHSGRPRRWAVEREPARKHEARESGYGSSGRESSEGRLQGRERHETRPRSVGASRQTTDSGRSLHAPRAQPEPSRGARTLRTAPVGAWRPPPSAPRVGATRLVLRRTGHPA